MASPQTLHCSRERWRCSTEMPRQLPQRPGRGDCGRRRPRPGRGQGVSGPRPSIESRFIFLHSVVAETPRSRATRPRSPSQRASAASMVRRSASSTASARVRAASPGGGAVPRAGSSWTSAARISRPGESAAACSIAFSSSRTLPGQSWVEQSGERLGGEDLPLAGAVVVALHEVRGEERHVLPPLPKRRDPDRHHREPVVQVLAEAALRDGAAEVLVRRRDHADVHLDRRRLAHPADLALLQRAQELRLEAGRGLADLVDEEGAAVRLLEHAAPGPDRAGEGAPRVAEELGLEERLGDRGAVHGHERLVPAAARDVDRPRDELLAGAGLPGDEHGRVGGRDAHDAVEHLAHRRGAADDVLEAVALAELAGEEAHLAEQPALLEGLRDAEEELVLLERLREEVVGALPDGVHGGLDRPVGGHHDDLGLRGDALGGAQHLHPVDARHAEIRQDDVERLSLDPLHRHRAVLRLLDRVPRLPEHDRGGRAHVLLVVDDEDLAGRGNAAGRREAPSVRLGGHAAGDLIQGRAPSPRWARRAAAAGCGTPSPRLPGCVPPAPRRVRPRSASPPRARARCRSPSW